MARLFVDTSAVYALLDRSDGNHARARALAARIQLEGHQLVTTNLVVAECHALILARLGRHLAKRWLQGFRWPVERVTEADEARAREIIAKYDEKDFSYTDAASFAVMERLGLAEVFAFDRYFAQFGFRLFGADAPDRAQGGPPPQGSRSPAAGASRRSRAGRRARRARKRWLTAWRSSGVSSAKVLPSSGT